ncbi:hypothetical protein POUND7_001043 [Theobroma cacao]
MNWCFKVKKRSNDETFFMENGAMLLEELIAFCNGKSNPIQNFSAEELKIATNNYGEGRCFLRSHDNFNSIVDYSETVLQMLTETYPERTWGADYYNLYEGYLQDRPVSVKKYISIDVLSKIFKDIAIGSQMSAHKNVLKLLGCCLETKYPIIVYEFVGTRILSDFLCDANGAQCQPLPWRCRLKIAVDLASAVEYLHTAFSKPVILHRDIRSSNVILDQDNVPKLIDFALSISIPECQLHVEEFESKYLLTLDVFNFGVLLLQLLSGKKKLEHLPFTIRMDSLEHLAENNQSSGVIDDRIIEEGIEQQQLLDFARLVRRCFSEETGKKTFCSCISSDISGPQHQQLPWKCRSITRRGHRGGGVGVGGLVWGVAWGGFVVGWRVSTFAPDQALMGYLTEKADVHSFGKILFQLLRGQRPSYYINVDSIVLDSVKHWVENNQFSRVVDHRIAIEGIEQEQLLDFTTLAREGEERPKIIKVARELSLFN